MKSKRMVWKDLRFDAALSTYQYDVVSLLSGNAPQCEGRHQVAARAAAGDENFHVRRGACGAEMGVRISERPFLSTPHVPRPTCISRRTRVSTGSPDTRQYSGSSRSEERRVGK